LHGNTILTFLKSGDVQADSCNYPTVTTRNRLNDFLPGEFRVIQISKMWFIGNYRWGNFHPIYPFQDGMVVTASGSFNDDKGHPIPPMVELRSGWNG
jgi:hypothetical protein